jgi:quercetin dioxygenase-like cupin family protein
MAIPHAYPGMPVDLLADGEAQTSPRSTALVKNETFEAIRLVIPKGQELSRHQVDGPITVQCLEGRIKFTCNGEIRDLKAGHWLFLLGGTPHSLSGVEDAVVLLTIMFPRGGGAT